MKSEESCDYVVGVDVSKAKLDIALPNESLVIDNNTKSIQQLVDRIASNSDIVVMEATGGWKINSCKRCTIKASHWLSSIRAACTTSPRASGRMQKRIPLMLGGLLPTTKRL